MRAALFHGVIMAAELLTDASRATDANSNPYAGAQWRFYAAGTLTPQNVYANADLSTSLGAVVTADAGGKFVPIYFDSALKYRGVLKSASGAVTIYDIDPINSGVMSQLADGGGAELVGVKMPSSDVIRTVDFYIKRSIDLRMYGDVDNNQAMGTALTNALADADTTGGKSATVETGAGRFMFPAGFAVPERVFIGGAGPQESIFSSAGTGKVFSFGSTSDGGILGARIGLSGVSQVGIDIASATNSVFRLLFRDLLIAGDESVGQRGFNVAATGGQIVTSCNYENIYFDAVDRPVREIDTEGNFWTNFTVNNFGYAATPAFDLQSHASDYIGHFRAAMALDAAVTGCVAYKQTGTRSTFDIVVDIQNNATALNINNDGKHFGVIRRPKEISPPIRTPIGTIGYGNRVFDDEAAYGARIRGNSTAALVGQVTLGSGWGSARSVANITGNQDFMQFEVNAAGTGMAQWASITIDWQDGLELAPQAVFFSRNGGNQPEANVWRSQLVNATDGSAQWGGTPVDGETYVVRVQRIG